MRRCHLATLQVALLAAALSTLAARRPAAAPPADPRCTAACLGALEAVAVQHVASVLPPRPVRFDLEPAIDGDHLEWTSSVPAAWVWVTRDPCRHGRDRSIERVVVADPGLAPGDPAAWRLDRAGNQLVARRRVPASAPGPAGWL